MKRLICVLLGVFLLMGAGAAWADDAYLGSLTTPFEISGYGQGASFTYTHDDADPWKGWFELTVQNTGSDEWLDFHFQIFGPTSVVFSIDTPYEPTSSQSLNSVFV